jgi:hypothetical protein
MQDDNKNVDLKKLDPGSSEYYHVADYFEYYDEASGSMKSE